MEMVLLTALGVGGATLIGVIIGFIFKKGNYINTYIVIQTSGLPNNVTLNLLDENSKQLLTRRAIDDDFT